MSDSTAVTRVLFEDFPPAAIVGFYVIAYTAIAVFFFGIYVAVRKYRRGAAAEVGGNLLARWQRKLSRTGEIQLQAFYDPKGELDSVSVAELADWDHTGVRDIDYVVGACQAISVG